MEANMDWRRSKCRGNSKSGKRNRSSLGLRKTCWFLRSHLSFAHTILQTVRKETLSEPMGVKGHSRNLTKSLLRCWNLHRRVSAPFLFIDLLGVGDGLGLVEDGRHAVIVPFTVPGLILLIR